MGVRLYNPTLGRFLQVDPVPGGSSNAYDYAGADPINKFDLDGKCWRHCWRRWLHIASRVAGAVSVGACFLGPAACLAGGIVSFGLSTADRWSTRGARRHLARNILGTGVDLLGSFLPSTRASRSLYKIENVRFGIVRKMHTSLHFSPWRGAAQGINYARSWSNRNL